MKVLETRQTSEEILLLSWSPRMDLLALVNVKGELSLHRLSWQRVWQWKLSDTSGTVAETGPPSFISWHPEGLFIVVGFERTAYILDVETGKDIHKHDLKDKLHFIQWSASKFEISTMNETPTCLPNPWLADQENDLDNDRVETNLSILLMGTCRGEVYAYTGGLLLALILTVPGITDQTIVVGDTSPNLKYFHFLVQGHGLKLVQFRNEAMTQLAPLLAPLGFKQTSIRNSWSRIQSQLTILSEHWEKIVDIYLHYMTYGKTRDQEEVLADYTEVLLVGVGTVELEIFLGSSVGTREKEAKKHLNTLNAAFTGIADALGKIKLLIISIIMDLVEIEGFLKHISHDKTSIVPEIRHSFSQLYFATLHLKKRLQDFFSVFRHFMRLIVNAVHIYHVVEPAVEFIEEDADPDKVLEFLATKVEKNIFDFLLENMSKENLVETNMKPKKYGKPLKFRDTTLFNFTGDNAPTNEWVSLTDYLAQHSIGEKIDGAPYLMDFSIVGLKELLDNSQLIPTIASKIEKLFLIPVINSTPFCTTSCNLMDNDSTLNLTCGMYMDIISSKTYTFAYEQAQEKIEHARIFLFEHDWASNKILGACVSFSRPVHSCQFFGGATAHLTVLSYDSDDKRDGQENGRTILCQVPLRLVPPKFIVIPFSNSVPFRMVKEIDEIIVDVPIDIYSPGPTTSTYIDQILPIEDFCPVKFSASGPRKVGAILGINKRTVVLLEMDTIEASLEDDADGTGTEQEDDSFEISEHQVSL